MGLISELIGLFSKKTIEDKVEITPKITEQLKVLGLTESDHTYHVAIEALHKYSDEGVAAIKKWTEDCKRGGSTSYTILRVYGPKMVNSVVDRYGSKSSEYLWQIMPQVESLGLDTIDKIVEEYGLSNVRLIGPIYHELKEAQKKTNEKIKQYKIRFIGKVQDVGFRATSEYYAKFCGITGTVLNAGDGSVLCEAQGTDSMINVFILAMERNFEVRKVKKRETELRYKADKFVSY